MGAGHGYQWLDGRRKQQRDCHSWAACGTPQHPLFSAYNQYPNSIFSLFCRVPLNSGTAHSNIRTYCSNQHKCCWNVDLRLGYAPKLQNCKAERGERIKVSFVSSPSKILVNRMSEEGLSNLYGWISTSLSLLTKVFSSSTEKSCCFVHILLDHVASSDTDSHVFPFSLFVHSFPHPGHCQLLVTAINVTPTSLSLPYLFWLPQTVLGYGMLTLQLCLGKFNLFMKVFFHFILITLHILFSTLDLHPSSKKPVWDILPIPLSTSQIASYHHFCSRSPCSSHWNTVLPHSHYRCTITSC